MSSSSYKPTLVKTIKLLAKDLFENAEKYVPDKDYMTDFDIWLHIPSAGYDREVPTIEVNAEFYPDKYVLAVQPDSKEAKEELEKPFPTF